MEKLEHFCYITDRGKGGQKKNDSKTVRWRHKPEFPQIYYEWNKSWQRGRREITHTHRQRTGPQRVPFTKNCSLKQHGSTTLCFLHKLAIYQPRCLSVRWSERKQKASKYPQLNRGKSARKREFVAEWNSQNSWHTQNSLFQLRNEFPGMGGSYLGSNHTCVI